MKTIGFLPRVTMIAQFILNQDSAGLDLIN